MAGADALMWLFAGPFIAAFVVIDVLVALDNWRHDQRERNEGSGGDDVS